MAISSLPLVAAAATQAVVDKEEEKKKEAEKPKFDETDTERFNRRVDEEEARKKEAQILGRQGIAKGLEKLSEQGELTPERVKEAVTRGAEHGLSEEDINSFLQKKNLQATPVSRSASIEAQNATQFHGLNDAAAFQNRQVALGAGSKGGSLESFGNKLLRTADKLKRRGYRYAAEDLAKEAGGRIALKPGLTSVEQKRALGEINEQQDRAAAQARNTQEDSDSYVERFLKRFNFPG